MDILKYIATDALSADVPSWTPQEKTVEWYKDKPMSANLPLATEEYFICHGKNESYFLLRDSHYFPYVIDSGEIPPNVTVFNFLLKHLLLKDYRNKALQQHMVLLLLNTLGDAFFEIEPNLSIKVDKTQPFPTINFYFYGRRVEGKDGVLALNKHTAKKFKYRIRKITHAS